MSVKINRSDSASPLLPNSAVPEAKGSRPAGPRHPSLFSKSLFSKAPKNSSTSMAPRDTTPLLSAEQRAARSDAPVQNARPGSMKPASSLLSRAQKAVSSGAKVVSSGMQQAGKAMSHAYQALNEPNYTRLHSNYSQEEMAAAAYYGVEPSSTPAVQPEPRSQRFDSAHTVPAVPIRVRPMTTEEAAAEDKRADYHNERPVHHVEEVDQAALARAQQQAAQAPRRQDSERVLMRPMNDAERAQEDARAEQHHEYPHYHDVVDHEAMAARRSQGNPPPRSQAAPTSTRPRPDFDAMAARLDALGQAAKARKNQGPAPQRPPEVRPEVRLSENVRPPVNGQGGRPQGTGPAPGRPAQPLAASRPAVHHAPSEPAKPARQPLAPLGVHTGNVPQPTVRHRPATGGKENTGPNVGRTSQHAAARKNMQAFAESFKRGDMNRDFSPKQLVVAMQGLAQGTRFEAAVAHQVNTNPKWGEQMQANWTALRKDVEARQASDPHAPSLEQIVGSPQLRTKLVRFLATGEGMERLLPPPKPQTTPPQAQPKVRPQAPLTAQVKVLDQQIAASKEKGDEIRHRMFHAATGPERIAATKESYAHKAQHDELIAARNQVQAQLQRVGNGAAGGQPVGRPRHDGVGQAQVPSHAPARVSSAAERAAAAELKEARAIVKEGPPDLHKMYDEAINRVFRNNQITQDSTLIEPEDKHMESVDFDAIQKKYDTGMARYNGAKAKVDAAANPERAQAQAAAFKAEVRAEAYNMAKQAYQSDVHDARETVKMGPVSYDQVLGWARAAADQNYTTVGSQRLDHDAIVRDYEGINQRFEAAKQFLAKSSLTGEETAARIDAQMAEAEKRVRQRHEGAGPGR